MITVELHDHAVGKRDVTRWLSSADFGMSVGGADSATVSLEVPFSEFDRVIPEEKVGFYVIIRNSSYVAIWWGICVGVSSGRSADKRGLRRTQTVTLTCESWISVLQQSRIILAPAVRNSVEGFIWNFETWSPAFSQWMDSLRTDHPGELLERVWGEMAKVELPGSMGGGTLGDEVLVEWRRKSVSDDQYLLIPVPGWALNASASRLPKGTIWGMIAGTFAADPGLVELDHYLLPLNQAKPTKLGTELGIQPILSYRIKPLVREPVKGPGVRATGLFQNEYLKKGDVAVPSVFNWSYQYSDNARNNAFFTKTTLQTGSQAGGYGILGDMTLDSDDIHKHGLRLREGQWPFFPSSKDSPDLLPGIDSITELAAEMYHDNHKYSTGTMQCAYMPSLGHGNWVRAQVGVGAELTGYAESVRHSVRVDTKGLTTADTSISYVRGSLDTVTRSETLGVDAPPVEATNMDLSVKPENAPPMSAPVTASAPTGDGWIVHTDNRYPTTLLTKKSQPIEGIALHYTATPARQSDNGIKEWMEGKRRESSTHFVVSRNGTIWQSTSLNDRATHIPSQLEYNGRDWINAWCLGVDLENVGWLTEQEDGTYKDAYRSTYTGPSPYIDEDGKAWEPYSDEQMEGARALLRLLGWRYPHVVDVFDHSDVKEKDGTAIGRVDPGPALDRDVLIQAFRAGQADRRASSA